MSNPVPPDRRGFPWPWRSAAFGWTVAGLLLIAGLPLYLRMPPWCDITLYDLAARNVLTGGVHYRDLFDTNPPGFVWSLAIVRTLFGWSSEALRMVDLGVVAAVVVLLGRLVRRAGGTATGVAWMAAAVALFYPFTTEYIHCQRDVWLMLPAVAVALLRVRRGQRRVPVRFRDAFVEGLILGLGAWIKPHILIPGAAVWLVSLPRLARSSPRPWLAATLDFAASFAGGLTALGGGLAWLVDSGAWPWFLEVFTFWNPGYLRVVFNEYEGRLGSQFSYFPPWSLFQPLAIVLAVGVLVRNLIVPLFALRTESAPSDDAWFARTVLAALFLVWAAQALFLQRQFAYAHVPEVLLMLALFTAIRVPVGFLGVVLAAVTSLVVIAFPTPEKPRPEWIVPHPLTDSARMAWWPSCWRTGLSDREYWERRNALGFEVHCFNGIDWVQLAETCDYLRSQGVRDGELIAWHDTPHAAYLLLGNRPRFRFMHVTTIVTIGGCQYERLRDELHTAASGNPPARYVIADLERVFWTAVPEQRAAMGEAGPGEGEGDLLPPAMRVWFPNICGLFPFDQPAVFRSAGGRGRYVVLRLDRPITAECFIHYGLGKDISGYNESPCEK